MIVGILDFETTGLDTATCHVNEHALILADIDPEAERRPKVLAIDTGLWAHNEPIPEELKKLNGITNELLLEYGSHPVVQRTRLMHLLGKADVLIGHNLIRYDREILAREYLNDLTLDAGMIFHKPVIDTLYDLPRAGKSGDLTYMAADYGIANRHAHRALFDCETLLALLGCMNKAAISQAVLNSSQDLVEVVADVSYHMKDRCKERGFLWDADTKTWRKIVRHRHFIDEQEAAHRSGYKVLPYPVKLPFIEKVMAHEIKA